MQVIVTTLEAAAPFLSELIREDKPAALPLPGGKGAPLSAGGRGHGASPAAPLTAAAPSALQPPLREAARALGLPLAEQVAAVSTAAAAKAAFVALSSQVVRHNDAALIKKADSSGDTKNRGKTGQKSR